MITEAILDYVQRTFNECRLMATSLTTLLTPYAEMLLHKWMQKSVRWKSTKILPAILSPLPSDIYRVFDFKKTCIVDLNCHTCSCGKWHILGIACGHAVAASRHSNIHEYGSDILSG
uniref:SWIM-type domain-containing protein n=1 Tax=Lactuca sativa TaxID=4236 RepID=A0A9R1UHT5_LACSA|nr:hypothetical protein LSAT_V11C900492770 [Lactuca sativa]